MNQQTEIEKKGMDFKVGWQFYTALILMLLTGVYLRYFMFDEVVPIGSSLKGFPQVVGNWENTGHYDLSDDVLNTLKVDDYVLGDFKNQDEVTLSLYVGYYKTHRRFAEIHTPEHCQAGSGWEILGKKIRQLKIQNYKEKVNFIEAVYEKNRKKMVFFYCYCINGKYIANFFLYKLSVIVNSLLHHRSDAAFVRIAVPVINDDISGAVKAGEKFLIEIVPVINTYLP